MRISTASLKLSKGTGATMMEASGAPSSASKLRFHSAGVTVPVNLGWHDIALRLALTFVAGVIVGFDRGEHGRPAGMRTTLLLSLAACVAMIQANLLMASNGKTPDSFVVLDVMRLPLGILSGVGFIGAGAILRRDNLVLGVTTAATMWFVTVMGLCFGGGQLALGLAAFALSMLVLSAMKWVEDMLPRQRRGTLILTATVESLSESEFRAELQADGVEIASWGVSFVNPARTLTLNCELLWRPRRSHNEPPAVVGRLARRPGVEELEWKS
jgi:putative Mg2+ transporter-C (MgtC) family protein